MEQKKSLVMEVLRRLQPYREMASDLFVIVKSSYCNEELLNAIINLLNKSIKNVVKGNQKEAIEKSIEQIKRIRDIEEKEKLDDMEIDDILSAIE